MGIPASAGVPGPRVCHRGQPGSAGQAHQTYAGELLAIIAPENLASRSVCHKLGFTFWKQAPVDGDIRNLYTLGCGGATFRSG